jgi:hypothetical protein
MAHFGEIINPFTPSWIIQEKGVRTPFLHFLGGNMGKIKGTRAGLNIHSNSMKTIHTLYSTDIVKMEYKGDYTNIVLNAGGWRTNHTKNCMNDILSRFDLKVIQKDFSWYLVDNDNTIAWDFEDGMNLGVTRDENYDMIIVRWGIPYSMKRKA